MTMAAASSIRTGTACNSAAPPWPLAACSFAAPSGCSIPAISLRQAAWWLGPQVLSAPKIPSPQSESRLFADAGTAVMTARDVRIVIKAGPFGEGSGGHSHSDVLSLTAPASPAATHPDRPRHLYLHRRSRDPAERNRFRGVSAHNTLRIDGRDQAIPAGPFRWNEKPEVAIHRWSTSGLEDLLEATLRLGRRLPPSPPHSVCGSPKLLPLSAISVDGSLRVIH